MNPREGGVWTRVMWPYMASRCRARVVVVLPVIVLSAAWMVECRRPEWTIGIDYVIACLLVVALRVLDDLADRPHDCPREPTRIVCQPGTTGPLASLAVLASLGAGSLLMMTRPWPAIVVAGMAYAIVGGWYGVRDKCHASRLVNSHVVLLKYPLLVGAFATRAETPRDVETGLAILLPAMICYLTLMLFELRDDRDLRGEPRSVWCWRVEAVGWVALLVGWLVVRLG